MNYNKLVRDKIPQQIAEDGANAIFRIASETEYSEYLEQKLTEELSEYRESEDPDELVDIYEVLLALAEKHGWSKTQFDKKATAKRKTSGTFKNRIILLEVEDPTMKK